MPFSILLLMTLGLLLAAVIQCLAPRTFRRGIFFGVTVEFEFHRSENARHILRRYRRSVIAIAFMCSAALWLAVPRLSGLAAPLTSSGLVFLEVSAAIVSMAAASRNVRRFRQPHSATRTAILVPRTQSLPGGWLTFVGPMLGVAAAYLLLFTRRNSMLPETYRGALALLLVAVVANAFFLWVAWLVLCRTRQIQMSGLIGEQESSDHRFGYGLRLLFAYYFTIFMVALALPFAGITPAVWGPLLVVILMAGWLVLGAIVLILVLKRRGRSLGAPAQSGGDNTPDQCWKWGLIYCNADDPAFVVGTRTGPFGCDLNFGNKWSRVVSIGILALPIIIRLLWF